MEVKPVKIFATANLPRLRYAADLILNEILGLTWEIVTDRRRLGKFPVINYSEENIPNSFRIRPGILVRGSRIHAVSGGNMGNDGMNVSNTFPFSLTVSGSSVPPNGRISVSSKPASTG